MPELPLLTTAGAPALPPDLPTARLADFGGQRESMDDSPEATAGRECAEETLGMLHSTSADAAAVATAAQDMRCQLADPGRAVCVRHALKRGAYCLYVTQASRRQLRWSRGSARHQALPPTRTHPEETNTQHPARSRRRRPS